MNNRTLRVLIACEESGVMRRAFAARGHDTWSCDLKPARDNSNHHIRGDVRRHLGDGWDLLVVAHPPCTRLCMSGYRWLYGRDRTEPKKLPRGRTWESMIAEFEEGVALFRDCWNAPVDRVAAENPRMHPAALERMPADLPRPHFVQPYWFGHKAFKETGFNLRGLPPLVPTDYLEPPPLGTPERKAWAIYHRAAPGPERAAFRSATLPGVAAACAMQWGDYAAQALAA